MTRSLLQIRMTTIVSSAVIIVSFIVMLLVAGSTRRGYEELINERLSDDITAITRIMEQKLLRVEEATKLMGGVVSQFYEEEQDLDSILLSGLDAVEGVWGIAAIFDKKRVPCEGYYERGVYVSEPFFETYINGPELEDDEDWVNCYIKGESCWGNLSSEYTDGDNAICYFVPVTGNDGERVGLLYSIILEKDLTSFVTEYKLRQDADISIYKPDGTMVVAPDQYILELSREDMIIRESSIDHLDWKIVLSADRHIIGSKVSRALISLALILAVMFLVIFLTIKYSVRYVATPFVRQQHQVEKEKAVMENEMLLASTAQNELLPHDFPPFPERGGIDIAACLHPARKVGGDLYDYFILDNKLFFCIGDVSGKGMQASLFMASAHYLFRSLVSGMPIEEAAVQMNKSLCTDNIQCRFVTFWLGCLDLGSGKLEYVNAGHDSPILIRDGRAEFFPESENMPFGVYEEEEFVRMQNSLVPGDRLLLYTDGITEAMNTQNQEFGKKRLLDAALNAGCSDASSVMDGVLSGVKSHSMGAEQSDDITMLCLKFIKNETK